MPSEDLVTDPAIIESMLADTVPDGGVTISLIGFDEAIDDGFQWPPLSPTCQTMRRHNRQRDAWRKQGPYPKSLRPLSW